MADYSGKWIKTSYPSKGVLLVSLSKPPVNSFDEPLWQELGNTIDRISKDGEIHAVVLASSVPKAFSAGLDLKEAVDSLAPKYEDPARQAIFLRDHVTPVIAALHGITFGLAIDISSACDIRYAAADTLFSIKEVDVGLAADIGSLARLPKITGNESLLRELAFTARPFSAEEALKLGLVSKVVPGSRNEVLSPIATVGTKHILLHSRDHSVRENLDYVATWNQAMLQSDDFKDSISSFASKKAPVFKPLPKL
ncbi:ClpP/crotonase [Cantharellus anzutake]|uniref:ClpP/crotonase n=1 Tax=Cantharellus anzutake TaxID=1750568 RepID=UPI00190834C4|nr:ClpP/crotonase [Cantharellus anzutake]KAF8339795.1 ClpP/crotonase [Cantharellus anzutake]